MITAYLLVVAAAALTIGLAVAYLRHLRLPRPPIGVFNRSDVMALAAGIVLAPFVYLFLPAAVAGALFGLTLLSVLLFTLQPVKIGRALRWLVAVALTGATAGVGLAFGTQTRLFAAFNALLVAACVVGVSNLWVQLGMRPKHLMALAAGLTVYDLVATAWLPVTANLLARLGSTPYAPVIFWPTDDRSLGLGLGDLLVVTTLTLVTYKGYGLRAALIAVAPAFAAVMAVLATVASGAIPAVVPTMAVLGPVTVLTCRALRRLPYPERTSQKFFADQAAERLPSRIGELAPQPGAGSSAPITAGGGERA